MDADATLGLVDDLSELESHPSALPLTVEECAAQWVTREAAMIGSENQYLDGFKKEMFVIQEALRKQQEQWVSDKQHLKRVLEEEQGVYSAELVAVQQDIQLRKKELDGAAMSLNSDIAAYKQARKHVKARADLLQVIKSDTLGRVNPAHLDEPTISPLSQRLRNAASAIDGLDRDAVELIAATIDASDMKEVLRDRMTRERVSGPLVDNYKEYMHLDQDYSRIWAPNTQYGAANTLKLYPSLSLDRRFMASIDSQLSQLGKESGRLADDLRVKLGDVMRERAHLRERGMVAKEELNHLMKSLRHTVDRVEERAREVQMKR